MEDEDRSAELHQKAQELVERIVMDMLHNKSTYSDGIDWEHASAIAALGAEFSSLELEIEKTERGVAIHPVFTNDFGTIIREEPNFVLADQMIEWIAGELHGYSGPAREWKNAQEVASEFKASLQQTIDLIDEWLEAEAEKQTPAA